MARNFWRACAVLLVVLQGACASVDPGPFKEFEDSLVELRDGADAAIAMNAEWTRENFVERVVAATVPLPEGEEPDEADLELVASLLIEQAENDALIPILPDAHVFMEVRRFRIAVGQLNAIFVEYAQLLGQMAAPELVPEATFDQMARDLNGNAGSAIRAFGQDIDGKELAPFSVAASGLARGWIQADRRSRLKEQIRANQAVVEAFAALGKTAVLRSAQVFANAYNDRSFALSIQIPENPQAAARKAKIEELIALNELYLDRAEAYRALRRGYQTLPQAHADLLRALEGESGLTAVKSLLAEGRRLKKLANEIAKSASQG